MNVHVQVAMVNVENHANERRKMLESSVAKWMEPFEKVVASLQQHLLQEEKGLGTAMKENVILKGDVSKFCFRGSSSSRGQEKKILKARVFLFLAKTRMLTIFALSWLKLMKKAKIVF